MVLKITTVKAFTKNPELGNPAVVIEAAVDSEEAMEAVRQAQCSVAAVMDSSQSPVPIRFFYEFGGVETFACGHATLAAAHVLLPQGESSNHFMNAQGKEVEVLRRANGSISQKQSLPEIARASCTPEDIMDALGVNREDLLAALPIKLVGSKGKMKLVIPMKRTALLSVDRNHPKVLALCEQTGATGLFLFALDIDGHDAHARHFPNRDEEDLVCGVGSLALAHYLKQHQAGEQTRFVIKNGPGKAGIGDVIVRLEEEGVYLEGYAVSI